MVFLDFKKIKKISYIICFKLKYIVTLKTVI